MLNINFIRENPTAFDNAMKQRGEEKFSKKILEIDQEKRNTQTILQNLLAEKNNLSKVIGKLKSENKDSKKEISRVEEVKREIITLKELENIKNEELKGILTRLPNIPHSSTPIGIDEKDNIFYKEWGKKPSFDFEAKTHFELWEGLGLMNFETGSIKVTWDSSTDWDFISYIIQINNESFRFP